jgi:META domain
MAPGGPEWQRVLDNVQATLTLPEAGRVAGNGSCNHFFGPAEINGDAIKLGPLGSSRKVCPEAVMNQETKYLEAVQAAERFEWKDPYLLIYCKGIEKALRFTRIAPGKPATPRKELRPVRLRRNDGAMIRWFHKLLAIRYLANDLGSPDSLNVSANSSRITFQNVSSLDYSLQNPSPVLMIRQFLLSNSHFIPVSWPLPRWMDSVLPLRWNSIRSPADVPS